MLPVVMLRQGTMRIHLCALLLISTISFALTNIDDRDIQQFSEFLEGVIKCWGVPGGVVTLVRDRRVVLTKSFGYYDLEKTRKIADNTQFFVGSLTKGFTSAVLAILLGRHKSYTWDTPIAQILGPSFRLANELLSYNVNLRDLLAHKVGLPSNFGPLLVGFPANLSREQFVQMLAYQPPRAPLRTKFLYSNYMYVLAGFVAERISGKTWERLVQDLLFDPLGMSDSGFVGEASNFSQFPSAFVHIDGKLDNVDQNLLYSVLPGGPAGSVYSTADDMRKWMNFHLGNGSSSNGSVIIPESLFSELHKEQINTPFSENNFYKPVYPISDITVSYCLGWVSSMYRGYRKLWHSGGIVGYSSMLWLFPDLQSGIFVALTGAKDNQNAPPIYTIVSQASDLLLGIRPWLNLSTACSFPAPWKDVKPIEHGNALIPHPTPYWNISVTPREYAGTYGHLAFGNITLMTDTEGMLLYYGRFGKMRLLPISDTLFLGYFLDSLSFVTNSDGNTKPFVIEFQFNDNGAVENLEFPVDLSVPEKTSFKRIGKSRPRYTRNNSVLVRKDHSGFRAVLSVTAAWCLFH